LEEVERNWKKPEELEKEEEILYLAFVFSSAIQSKDHRGWKWLKLK